MICCSIDHGFPAAEGLTVGDTLATDHLRLGVNNKDDVMLATGTRKGRFTRIPLSKLFEMGAGTFFP